MPVQIDMDMPKRGRDCPLFDFLEYRITVNAN